MFYPPELGLLVSWIWSFLKDWWWLVSPPFFAFLFHDLWLLYVRWKRFYGLEWVLLEIKLPQVVERTPQAMEQVFAGLHGMWSKPKVTQKYFRGEVPNWFSCEIASIGGETHFYVRALAKFRNLVESHVWAQYPDAEIREADDYVESVPRGIPDANWDVWGVEYILEKPDVYPIRTYIEFESPVEERRIDPLAAVLEVMSSLRPGEQLWYQIIAEPIFDGWHAQGQAIVAKLIGRQQHLMPAGTSTRTSSGLGVGGILSEAGRLLFPPPTSAQGKAVTPQWPSVMTHLSPGEKDIVEAIGRTISKLAFRIGIRVVYAARRDVYNSATPNAVFGSFRQFNTLNLNSLAPNRRTLPSVYYIFPKSRNHFRKRRLDWRYRLRFFHGRFSKRYIFNIEELATIYHFPGLLAAKAPSVGRIQAKRAEPPSALPTA